MSVCVKPMALCSLSLYAPKVALSIHPHGMKNVLQRVEAILSLKNAAECRAFLEDVMTGKEIQDCGQRLMVAQLLSRQMIYSQIAELTGASSATISRVNRCYVYGAGGYRTVLPRLSGSQADKEPAEEGSTT